MAAQVITPTEVRQRFDRDIDDDDDDAPHWFTDAHAVFLHRIDCGCLCPENKDRVDFYGGRTQMPFPTFSATAEDLG